MTHQIHVQFATDKKTVPTSKHFKDWARLALQVAPGSSELTIRIVAADEMQDYNHQYRQKNKPTNVLSFPYDAPPLPKRKRQYLGDILICPEVVNREAVEQEKAAIDHWAHMVVHGTLHLLGYDHISEVDANEMESLEKKLLAEIDIADPYQ